VVRSDSAAKPQISLLQQISLAEAARMTGHRYFVYWILVASETPYSGSELSILGFHATKQLLQLYYANITFLLTAQ